MNNHVTVLEIDGNALLHNLHYFKQKIKKTTQVLVVVKAAGYGSDGVKIADYLKNNVDYFGVAYTHEGIALRKAGIKNPILVLHPQIQNLATLIEYDLEPNLYNFKILECFLALSKKEDLKHYPVHIKLNTGLNRLGFSNKDTTTIIPKIKASKNIQIISLFSHLAASEDANEIDFSKKQIELFTSIAEEICRQLSYQPMLHMLNTSGVVNYPKAQFDMIRLGIGLYGFGNDEQETLMLKNTHNLTSIISQIHTIQPEETVGYNRAFKASRISKIATIPIGHADGISRKLGNGKGYVFINNQKALMVGNICMDMIMVDITEITCAEGDQVILYNNQKTIEDIANICETIPYEILTASSHRIKKILKS